MPESKGFYQVLITMCVTALIVISYAAIFPPAVMKDFIPAFHVTVQRYTPFYIKHNFSEHDTLANEGNQTSGNCSVKRIVLWNKFFASDSWHRPFPQGASEMEINCRRKCILSINRTHPLSYDAVVFHPRDGHEAPNKRSSQQVYIMFNLFSPVYRSNSFYQGDTFYNWTSTYSTKSDVIMKHASTFRLPQRAPDILKTLPQMQKKRENGKAMIAWIVSHCAGASKRFKYVKELKKHISVNVFGSCGQPCPGGTRDSNPDCFQKVGATGQYKFYLAFENSMCQDYISEKPYRALNASMLPVVLGGTSTWDYTITLPTNSFIDIRNFSTPKLLAEYLKHLDTHDEEYLSFHRWRTGYYVQEWAPDNLCLICDALHNKTLAKPRNVNWNTFWNDKMCDNGLVTRLLSKI